MVAPLLTGAGTGPSLTAEGRPSCLTDPIGPLAGSVIAMSAKPASSLRPVPKVAAAGAGGLTATVLIFVAALVDVELSGEAAAGIVALASTLAGYAKRDKRRDRAVKASP